MGFASERAKDGERARWRLGSGRGRYDQEYLAQPCLGALLRFAARLVLRVVGRQHGNACERLAGVLPACGLGDRGNTHLGETACGPWAARRNKEDEGENGCRSSKSQAARHTTHRGPDGRGALGRADGSSHTPAVSRPINAAFDGGVPAQDVIQLGFRAGRFLSRVLDLLDDPLLQTFPIKGLDRRRRLANEPVERDPFVFQAGELGRFCRGRLDPGAQFVVLWLVEPLADELLELVAVHCLALKLSLRAAFRVTPGGPRRHSERSEESSSMC